MRETTVWDVYTKTQENKGANILVNNIAKELSLDTDIVMECAIVLDQLNLVRFNADSKEIFVS